MISRNARCRALLPLLAVLGLPAAPTLAFVRPGAPLPSNVEGRAPAAGGPAAAPGRALSLASGSALAKLAANAGGTLVVHADTVSGTPRAIYAVAGTLAPALEGRREPAALAFVKENAALLGVSAHDLAELELVPSTRPSGLPGPRDVRFRQVHDGLPVYRAGLRVHFDPTGGIVGVTTEVVPGLSAVPRAALDAATAAGQAALDVGRDPTTLAALPPASGAFRLLDEGDPLGFGLRAEPMVYADGRIARPAWIVGIGLRGEVPAYYEVAVDAITGETLSRVNLVAYAGGYAFPLASPTMTGPGCPATSGPASVSFDPTPESPLGYVDASLWGTVGNNVRAQDDRASVDYGQPAPPTGAGRWDHVWTNSYATTGNVVPDLHASITSLFYMNNWVHDRLYRRGFDEASGNFQRENFGRGGLPRDPVWADAMDGGGTNNANFGTDVDGVSPRMQMYLFTLPRRDGDVDNSVVVHEYGHGVSHRLVGVSCLAGHEAGSMGEGWSDFFACSAFDTPLVGAYVTGNCSRGIRRASYAPGLFPYTYGDICSGGSGCQVHDDGEVWAAVLWLARELVAARVPARDDAACIVETLVIEGMKLSPCNPTMLAARDGILSAARDKHPELLCLLWEAFADRGMGFSATSTGAASTSGRQEAFDLPADCSACSGGLAAPAPLAIDTSLPNQVTLTWPGVPGATSYGVYVSAGGCGGPCSPPDQLVLATVTGTMYTDAGVSGDHARTYLVRAFRSPLCAGNVVCREVTPSGRCSTAPRFTTDVTGATFVESQTSGTCGLVVRWSPAASACPTGASLVYNVYRGTTPSFLPGSGNRIASVPEPALSYTDLGVQPQTTYYYVVRAEDTTSGGQGPNGGNEEANLVRRAASTWGAPTGTAEFYDSLDPAPLPGWTHSAFPAGVPDDWTVLQDARTGGSNAWHVGHIRAATLGLSAAIKDLVLPPLVLSPASVLTFDHKMDAELQWDGGVLEISADGGKTWRDLTADITTGGYNSTTISMMTFLEPPNGNRLWTGVIPTGFAGFQRVTVSLAPYAGTAPVLLRFRSLWDADSPVATGMCTGPAGATYCGWYIDNVRVSNVVEFGICTTGASCTATASATPLGPTRYCLGGTVRLDASGSSLPGCAGAPVYQWHRDGVPSPGPGRVTYDMPTWLAAGTYACAVEVSCATEPACRERSSAVTITVDPTPPLSRVADVLAARRDIDAVLTWSQDPNALGGYRIYRVPSKALVPDARAGEPGVTLAGETLPNPLQTTFTDSGIVRGQPFNPALLYFQVLSVCSGGTAEGPN